MKYITVDNDRYCGAYSGAPFTAWIGEQPSEIDSGDSTCEEFWENDKILCGKGLTPIDAVKNLLDSAQTWVGSFDIIDLNWRGEIRFTMCAGLDIDDLDL